MEHSQVSKVIFILLFSVVVGDIYRENVLVYDTWSTVVLGLRLRFPSEVLEGARSAIKAQSMPDSTKEARIRQIDYLGNVSDRSLRREMIEANKLVIFDLQDENDTHSLHQNLDCTSNPNRQNAGNCKFDTSPPARKPPKKTVDRGFLRDLKRSIQGIPINATSCELAAPCIYILHLSNGSTFLYVLPFPASNCPQDCFSVTQLTTPIGELDITTKRWKGNGKIFPCGTRRRNSVMCRLFITPYKCVCEFLIQMTQPLPNPPGYDPSPTVIRTRRSPKSVFISFWNFLRSLLKMAPKAMWKYMKKHPLKSMGYSFAFATGVYTVYDIVDTRFLNPIPRAEDLLQIYEKMEEEDKILKDLNSDTKLLTVANKRSLGDIQKDYMDVIENSQDWLEALTSSSHAVTSYTSKLTEGIRLISAGDLPYTIISAESMGELFRSRYPSLSTIADYHLSLRFKLLVADFSTNTIWGKVTFPEEDGMVFGRLVERAGVVDTNTEGDEGCYSVQSRKLLFSRTTGTIQENPAYELDISSCVRLRGTFHCPHSALMDKELSVRTTYCWPFTTKRRKRDTSSQPGADTDYIDELFTRQQGTPNKTTSVIPSQVDLRIYFTELQHKITQTGQEIKKHQIDVEQDIRKLSEHDKAQSYTDTLHTVSITIVGSLLAAMALRMLWERYKQFLYARQLRQDINLHETH